MAAEEHDEERPRLTSSPAGAGAAGAVARPTPDAGSPASGGGVRRLPGFLRASWAELRRVRWPDRTQVAQGTGVVLVFVAVAGAFLGAVDSLAARLVDLII